MRSPTPCPASALRWRKLKAFPDAILLILREVRTVQALGGARHDSERAMVAASQSM